MSENMLEKVESSFLYERCRPKKMNRTEKTETGAKQPDFISVAGRTYHRAAPRL